MCLYGCPYRLIFNAGDAVEKMVKSDAWKDILKQKGWDDAYLGGDAFEDGRIDPVVFLTQ